jgi:hypothetical protein
LRAGAAPAAALAVALLAAGCAEMLRPPPPEPPGALTGGVVLQPNLAILDAAARRFGGEGLPAGQPAEVALAVARLEWLGSATAPGGPLAGVPGSEGFALALAIEESRAAFGIAREATPQQTVAALLAARAALLAGDRAAAERALAPPAFRAARPPPLDRLAEPPPLPVAAQALPALAAVVDREAAGRDIGPTGLIDQNAATGAGLGVPQIR